MSSNLSAGSFFKFLLVFPSTCGPVLLLSKVLIRPAGGTTVEVSIVSKVWGFLWLFFFLYFLSAKYYPGSFEKLIVFFSVLLCRQYRIFSEMQI